MDPSKGNYNEVLESWIPYMDQLSRALPVHLVMMMMMTMMVMMMMRRRITKTKMII